MNNNVRIAWLLPTAWFYWQPSISELTQLFPRTKVFAGLFPGFAQGFEDALEVEMVGERKVVSVKESKQSYGDNFTVLSPKIVTRLLDYRPEIVFSSSFGVWTILAILFKWLGRWKVVIAYEGSSPGVDYRNSAMRLVLRRIMVSLADACISNSHAGKRYLIEVLKARPELTFRHPYEVPDRRSLAAVDETLNAVVPGQLLTFSELKKPVFIFIGSLVPRKGVRCLLEACKLLKDAGEESFTALIVGDGEEREALQTYARQNHLDAAVVWTGQIDYSKIGTYFHHADVFVLPTLEDTWGMVVLEAMLLGKPIICSTGAGAAELVRQGENGYQFFPQDSSALAQAMKVFIDKPELVAPMGQVSRDILDKYSPQAAAQFMADVVSKLCV